MQMSQGEVTVACSCWHASMNGHTSNTDSRATCKWSSSYKVTTKSRPCWCRSLGNEVTKWQHELQERLLICCSFSWLGVLKSKYVSAIWIQVCSILSRRLLWSARLTHRWMWDLNVEVISMPVLRLWKARGCCSRMRRQYHVWPGWRCLSMKTGS